VNDGKLARRAWLRLASRVAAGVPLGFTALSQLQAAEPSQDFKVLPSQVAPAPIEGLGAPLFSSDPTRYRFTSEEDTFLEELERACFQFFWDEVNPATGLVKDRSQAGGPDSRNVASNAATGFLFNALSTAYHRAWQDPT